MLFDELKVLYHAQVISVSVTPIQVFQPAAGEVPAFITEPHQPFPDKIAVFSHENAMLSPRPAAGATGLPEALFIEVLFVCLIADA
jgi:hypothetical protein